MPVDRTHKFVAAITGQCSREKRNADAGRRRQRRQPVPGMFPPAT